jgi:hypothetical protein
MNNITPCNSPENLMPRCGAKTRKGSSCLNFPIAGKRRCKFHGGKSCGPRTAEGRAAIAKANTKHGRYIGQRKKAVLAAYYKKEINRLLTSASLSGLI